jgi:hypothetical protein
MAIVHLPKLLSQSAPGGRQYSMGMSVAVCLGYSGFQLQRAFAHPYVVQDDARQHVVWLRRFLDPGLFPQDWIADYYQSVAPLGYATLYRSLTWVGIDPIVFSKVLPLILGLIATFYIVRVCFILFPVAIAGFLAALFLNQTLWTQDDLASGTARAFLYPLMLAFFHYLLQGNWLACLGTIALQGLFYPPCIFTSVGVLFLRLWGWQQGQVRVSRRRDLQLCLAGLLVAFLVLLPTVMQTSEFGPTVSRAIAQTMPEFMPTGRTAFFNPDWEQFWLKGQRSGFLPYEWGVLPFWLKPPQVWLSLLLPVLLCFPRKFPLIQHLRQNSMLLLQVLLVSTGMFLLAHAVLFKLYLPSRYSQPNLRILAALAGAIVLVTLVDGLLRSLPTVALPLQRSLLTGSAVLLMLWGTAYPALRPLAGRDLVERSDVTGQAPALYQFLAQQPEETLIASLSDESENLPAFAGRSVLLGREFAIPYSLGYYREIRQRAIDLLNAQYSPSFATVQRTIDQYGIDFWLLEDTAFQPQYIENKQWLMQYQPAASRAIEQLQQGMRPALVAMIDRCTRLREQQFILLQATCMKDVQSHLSGGKSL